MVFTCAPRDNATDFFGHERKGVRRHQFSPMWILRGTDFSFGL